MNRVVLALTVALTLPACGGDDGEEASASTTDTGSATADGTESSSTESSSTESTDTGDGDGDGDATITATGDGDGDGDGDTTVVLQNDGFVENAMVGFQGGFVTGECFASTFDPDPGDTPFTLLSAQALIGPASGMVNMTVTVWEVDPASGKPTTEMAAGVPFSLMGADSAFNEVQLDSFMLPELTGSFAISFCHDAHDGAPSIARDDDGDIQAGKNWIWVGDTWFDTSALPAPNTLTGDWILRATIEPTA